jgi:hypothetical protein
MSDLLDEFARNETTKVLCELVEEGNLAVDAAAKALKITIESFLNEMDKGGYSLPNNNTDITSLDRID